MVSVFQFLPQLNLVLTPLAVNELSNKIDLQSTLHRAHALFRRFQRTVEAIDKKQNFPTPTVRQRKPASSDPTHGSANGSASGHDRRNPKPASANAPGSPPEAVEKERVISPELRHLLSRKVDKLEKEEVKDHGGGIGS